MACHVTFRAPETATTAPSPTFPHLYKDNSISSPGSISAKLQTNTESHDLPRISESRGLLSTLVLGGRVIREVSRSNLLSRPVIVRLISSNRLLLPRSTGRQGLTITSCDIESFSTSCWILDGTGRGTLLVQGRRSRQTREEESITGLSPLSNTQGQMRPRQVGRPVPQLQY